MSDETQYFSVSFLRHAAFFNPDIAGETVLNIIGVGATGSFIGEIAARMGFTKFRVFDADIVEDHNLPNQIYEFQDIGKKKVDAFKRKLQAFNPAIEVETHDYFFVTEDHKELIDGPLVLTVDTMSARKDIYDAFKFNWRVKKVFETKLGFDYGELNIINNLSKAEFEQWYAELKDDDEVEEGPCDQRICTTLVASVASYTVHQICDMLSKEFNEENFVYKKKSIFAYDGDQNIFTHALA